MKSPRPMDDVVISSVADSQGNFTNIDFAPAQNDLNRNFILTAIGRLLGFILRRRLRITLTRLHK